MKICPVDNIIWIDRDKLKQNDYNPNVVFSTEMDLLEKSIIEDGWTQPIVINEDFTIVDGFHRYTVSGREAISKEYGNKVPCVILESKTLSDRKISTVRHNRARGQHRLIEMQSIVSSLKESGLSDKDICQRMGLSMEEIKRLSILDGCHLVAGKEYSEGIFETNK